VKLLRWISWLRKLLLDRIPSFFKVHDLTEKPSNTLVPQVFPNPRPNLMFDLKDESLKKLEVDELLEVTPSKKVEVEERYQKVIKDVNVIFEKMKLFLFF